METRALRCYLTRVQDGLSSAEQAPAASFTLWAGKMDNYVIESWIRLFQGVFCCFFLLCCSWGWSTNCSHVCTEMNIEVDVKSFPSSCLKSSFDACMNDKLSCAWGGALPIPFKFPSNCLRGQKLGIGVRLAVAGLIAEREVKRAASCSQRGMLGATLCLQ